MFRIYHAPAFWNGFVRRPLSGPNPVRDFSTALRAVYTRMKSHLSRRKEYVIVHEGPYYFWLGAAGRDGEVE